MIQIDQKHGSAQYIRLGGGYIVNNLRFQKDMEVDYSYPNDKKNQ